jgi:hypothetical protein
MGDLFSLDEYRKKRIAEGTWPLDTANMREYWLARHKETRERVERPPPPPPPKKKVTETIKDAIFGPSSDHPVHPV